ncbi:hypothetical protein AB0E59_37060 [Lentzea sp. NPDC034063]|uniref:hypothetical protein n=1 Tax=unclassified Lentzea TaxID=2643253 RepID=UPI0033D9CCBD
MTGRLPWDPDSYLALARRACFVCELLVAPVDDREHVITDFTPDEYTAIENVVHRAGSALGSLLPVERLYVLSLGSRQANRHVHWHLAPLPPGVPREDQQIALFEASRGHLDLPDDEVADLARKLGERMAN